MTEELSRRYADLDQWPLIDAVEAIYEGQLAAVAAVKPAVPALAEAARQAAVRLAGDEAGRLIYAGAGTSGRLAVQDGVELVPTSGWPRERLAFCLAGGFDALTRSAEAAEDSAEDAERAVAALNLGAGDVLIAVAASGVTPYSVGVLRAAKARGALTIAIANNPGTPLLAAADCPILAVTGSELVAGSTRMKAGTAQKALLNMLSTAIMLRLGRVHAGYMVNMAISNRKLRARAVNMIADIGGCAPATADAALAQSDGDIKMAVLICQGHAPSAARALLADTRGNLRQALLAATKNGDQ